MQLFLVFFGLPMLGFRIEPWTAAVARPDLLRQRLSRRDLARRRRGAAARPMGCRRQPRPALPPGAAARHPAAGLRDHPRADGRLPGPAHQEHRPDLDHRLRGAAAHLQRHQQRDLPALHRLRPGRADLLCALLSADALCPGPGASRRQTLTRAIDQRDAAIAATRPAHIDQGQSLSSFGDNRNTGGALVSTMNDSAGLIPRTSMVSSAKRHRCAWYGSYASSC